MRKMRPNRKFETTRPATSRRNQTTRGRHSDPDYYKCALCRNLHALRFCRKFLRMDTKRKEAVVEKYRYCVNCLAKSHDLRSCTSMDTCRICDKFHRTLLHQKRKSTFITSLITSQIRHRRQQNTRRNVQPARQHTVNQPTNQQVSHQLLSNQLYPLTPK
ncbi:uncharacterized protein LOC124419432 [Lucilia cuprina]|uniref:uncharacterized protein LOC124419432 n=1 Tax=Lucilia cuprina TaxID=7375 RepID=UPI001F0659B5|nr:uncharacterized protein LOC124419432 [Lucilia cuprina]XP_046804818.1 uncharacterized protein LOC124419432 [Lucilia cuprina]